MIADINTIKSYMDMGGFVMIPLIVVSVFLWYGLVVRMLNVRSSRNDPRQLLHNARKGKRMSGAVTERAAMIAVAAAAEARSHRSLKARLNEHFQILKYEMSRYRYMVRSLVLIAPLLGLLGTVDGMIETFESLGEMALFTQTGGIAGGISRALFTTQIGLAISIPGLMIGRIIERKQFNISRELDQIRDLMCAEKPEEMRA